MKYFIVCLILFSSCFAEDTNTHETTSFYYKDGWKFKAIKQDPSAGGAIIERKEISPEKNADNYYHNEKLIRQLLVDPYKSPSVQKTKIGEIFGEEVYITPLKATDCLIRNMEENGGIPRFGRGAKTPEPNTNCLLFISFGFLILIRSFRLSKI